MLAPSVRKRYKLPLRVELDEESIEAGAVSVAWVADGPKLVRDVGVKFTTGGTVGVAGIEYALTYYYGAYGSTYSDSAALPLSGSIEIDGIAWTFSGAIATDAVVSYSTITDSGTMASAAMVAAWMLLHSRGVDPKTEQDLQKGFDAAMAWAKALGTNDGELEQDGDATPGTAEMRPRGHGQTTPWAWLTS